MQPCQLLSQLDSPAFERISTEKDDNAILVICDHASNAVPKSLDRLGIEAHHYEQHIGYDIGAAGLSRCMAKILSASAVLSGFSRLVIDPNRYLSTPDSIPSVSDGVRIIGNENLSWADRALRIEALFLPYHYAINQEISNICTKKLTPFIISMHSFTPVFQGEHRPWEIGVLWDDENPHDKGEARFLIEYLRKNSAYMIGDNQPYHACDPVIYSLKTHANTQNIDQNIDQNINPNLGDSQYPHVLIEVRQDLIIDEKGQLAMAVLLCAALSSLINALEFNK